MSFLNVDLDLVSSEPLTAVVDALGDRVVVLHDEVQHDGCHVSLEVTEPCYGAGYSVETVLARFCDLLEALDGEARVRFAACRTIDFDVGLESPRGGQFVTGVSTRTLARIAALGGTLSVTLYPVFDDPPATDDEPPG